MRRRGCRRAGAGGCRAGRCGRRVLALRRPLAASPQASPAVRAETESRTADHRGAPGIVREASLECRADDAVVVVRALGDEAGARTRDARDAGGRHRRVRGPARVPAGARRCGAGIRMLPFLSDEFLDTLRFVGDKARELGLRMDLTLGSGWPFGGPHVPVALASSKLRTERASSCRPGDRAVPVRRISRSGEQLIAVFLEAPGAPMHRPAHPAAAARRRCRQSARSGRRTALALLHRQPHGHAGQAGRRRR